jgi:uncharacterized DUF497 family protein
MQTKLIWDEAKRVENLSKHGLDFAQAHWVLDSSLRMDADSMRNGELRVQSFSYVLDVLAVLTVVHTEREQAMRVISFRRASNEEREVYYEWIDNQ